MTLELLRSSFSPKIKKARLLHSSDQNCQEDELYARGTTSLRLRLTHADLIRSETLSAVTGGTCRSLTTFVRTLVKPFSRAFTTFLPAPSSGSVRCSEAIFHCLTFRPSQRHSQLNCPERSLENLIKCTLFITAFILILYMTAYHRPSRKSTFFAFRSAQLDFPMLFYIIIILVL